MLVRARATNTDATLTSVTPDSYPVGHRPEP